MLGRTLYRRGSGHAFIRQLNPAAWFRFGVGITVTGSGVSQWDDQSGNARHLKQSSDSARPIALLHAGTNYLYLPGVASNSASATVVDATNFDVMVYVSLDDWTPSSDNVIFSNGTSGAGEGFLFYVKATTGVLQCFIFNSTNLASSAAPTVSDGGGLWVRVRYVNNTGGGQYSCKFYTSTDAATTSPASVSWAQLGVERTGSSLTPTTETGSCRVGARSNTQVMAGKAYAAYFYDGPQDTTGTLVRSFRAWDGTDQASSVTSGLSDATVWTINTSGAKPAQIVARSSLLFDGSAHYLKCDAFTLNQPETVYLLFKQVSWTNSDTIFDGDMDAQGRMYQIFASPQLQVSAGTALSADGNLAVGAYGISAVVFNGASSVYQANLNTPVTGNAGSSNMSGFTLGTRGSVADRFANIQVLEAIIFSAAHDATQRARVIRYLAGCGGVAL